MRRHLKRDHPNLISQRDGEFVSYPFIKIFTNMRLTRIYVRVIQYLTVNNFQIFSQENFHKTLLKWIVCSSQPFSVVEEDEFIELIRSLNPTAELVSDKTIKADLMATYLEKVEEIKQLLKGVPGKISVTMYMWSSKNVLPFLVIRVHWISTEWEYRTQLLDFAPVEGDHDGKTQFRLFEECMTRFDIPLSKVLAFTMDNGTPNDTFITRLQDHGVEIGLNFSECESRIRCLAHILNLSVQDML